jgi:hypothetical protein
VVVQAEADDAVIVRMEWLGCVFAQDPAEGVDERQRPGRWWRR